MAEIAQTDSRSRRRPSSDPDTAPRLPERVHRRRDPEPTRIYPQPLTTRRKRGENFNPSELDVRHEHRDVRQNPHGSGRLPVA